MLERILNRYERLRAVKIKQPDLNLNPAIYKKYFNNNSDKLIFKDNASIHNNKFIYFNFSIFYFKNLTLNLKDQISLLKQDYKNKILLNINTFIQILINIKQEKLLEKVGIKNYKSKIINDFFILKYNQFIKINVDKEKKILEIKQLNQKGRVIIINSILQDWKIIFNGNNKAQINSLIEDNLTGCLTIFNSKVKNLKLNAKNIYCEDAVNFINSSGNIKEIFVSDSISDSIDADFSELVFDSVIIDKSQNDCFDVSFGSYVLTNANLKNCGDKGISVGEQSNLNITNALIEKSNIGIASKDGAFVKAKNVKLRMLSIACQLIIKTRILWRMVNFR